MRASAAPNRRPFGVVYADSYGDTVSGPPAIGAKIALGRDI
jgi:hypothetical protein